MITMLDDLTVNDSIRKSYRITVKILDFIKDDRVFTKKGIVSIRKAKISEIMNEYNAVIWGEDSKKLVRGDRIVVTSGTVSLNFHTKTKEIQIYSFQISNKG